ncbi:MAG: ydaM 3 [Proteobacteria bacterium]|nr:ydaM 3 [Pseudomonadota bacterium]
MHIRSLLVLPLVVAAIWMFLYGGASMPAFGVGMLAGFLPPAIGLWGLWCRFRRQAVAHYDFTQNLIDVIPHPVYVKDAQSRYRMVNRAFLEDQESSAESIIGRTVREITNDSVSGKTSLEEDAAVLAGAELRVERHDVHPLTGAERHRVIMKGSCPGLTGERLLVGGNFDITHWWISEQNLLQAKQRLQEALENEVALRQRTEDFIQRLIDVIPDPVFIKKSGGQYVMINEAFARYRDVDKLKFKAFLPVPKNPLAHQKSLDEDARVLSGEDVTKEDHTIRQATGEEVFRIISKRRSIFVDGDPVIVGVEHHITEWRLAERELKRLAEEDALTGIANRRHFNREAERAIEQAHRYNEQLSLLMLDIDFFKRINDCYGHTVGDEVLCEMARRMQLCLRKSDLPGRWGGEEFVALLPHTMLETALMVAERLRAEFADLPVGTSAGALPVTFSGGSAQLRPDDSLQSLTARADAALYRAKNSGRNRIENAETGATVFPEDNAAW